MAKLQIQQTFSHKQKTYWLISEELDRAATILNINNKDTIETAKSYWHKYMRSGKLTRASVRKGLIAACLFYSCTKNNNPIERQEIIKAFNCDTKTLSKGEKHFWNFKIKFFLFLLCLSGSIHNCMVQESISFKH